MKQTNSAEHDDASCRQEAPIRGGYRLNAGKCQVCGETVPGGARKVCPGACALARKTALQKRRRQIARARAGRGDE